jgi:FAD/FMN-containing dehydrogenase
LEAVLPNIVVYCRTADGVAKAVRWCSENEIGFSVRSGGHCYEGLSRHRDVVIDVRGISAIDLRLREQTVSVGSGVMLGSLYEALGRHGAAIPVGTCPGVGIAGHAAAGGLGFLVRQFGLACDNLRSIELVNANGELVTASHTSNGDLFWALRGAGAGSLGVITKLQFRTHQVPRVHTYLWEETISVEQAANFLLAWQQWLETAPREVSASVFMRKRQNRVLVQFRALAVGREGGIRFGLDRLVRELRGRAQLESVPRTFLQAFRWFSEGEDALSGYEKAKSDILKHPLSWKGAEYLVGELPPEVDAEFFALGGAVNDLEPAATAFPHRRDSLLVLQWGVSWRTPAQGIARMKALSDFYARIRPFMSAGAFLNYLDLELPNPARAYWGTNLEELVQVKRRYDPGNLFRHALSIPTSLADFSH